MAAKVHVRSNSFPSRTHPVTIDVEEHLLRIQSSEAASTSSSSVVSQKLGSLKDLHDSISDWLQLSQTQHALSNQINRKSLECLLDGSLVALDVCGTLQDIVSQMKGCIQELESSFRRKRAVNLSLASEVESYFCSRKKIKKLASKTLSSLKRMEKQNDLKNDSLEDEAALNLLRQVHLANISVFESFLCFLSRPHMRSSSWPLVSKVMWTKRVSSGASEANEAHNTSSQLWRFPLSQVALA